MLKLVEPQWGFEILNSFVKFSNDHEWFARFAPLGADIFVFVYPVYLVVLYLYAMWKQEKKYKELSLFVFFACLFSVLFNIFLQQFVDKARPNFTLGLLGDVDETLLHTFLPPSAFPSDHAVVSMSIAIATILWAMRFKNPFLLGRGIVLALISVVMGICRITVVVHWPTDVLGGILVGVIIPSLLFLPCIYKYLKKWLILPIISLQEKIIPR